MDYGNLLSEFSGLIIALFIIGILVCLAIMIPFIITVKNCISLIAPSNRKVQPNSAWFLLIPIFNIIWYAILFYKVADSLNNEYAVRDIKEDAGLIRGMGIAICISSIFCLIPLINTIVGFANFAFFIILWVQVSSASSKIRRDMNVKK